MARKNGIGARSASGANDVMKIFRGGKFPNFQGFGQKGASGGDPPKDLQRGIDPRAVLRAYGAWPRRERVLMTRPLPGYPKGYPDGHKERYSEGQDDCLPPIHTFRIGRGTRFPDQNPTGIGDQLSKRLTWGDRKSVTYRLKLTPQLFVIAYLFCRLTYKPGLYAVALTLLYLNP